jgi:kynureninase
MIDRDVCLRLDAADPLTYLRERFTLPPGVIYLDGNSLGALPKHVPGRMQEAVTNEWGRDLIRSWNLHGWVDLPHRVGDRIADLIGAPQGSVIACDSTTVNLFKAVSAALRMTERTVVLSDSGNFPTDLYAMSGIGDLRVVDADAVLDSIGTDVAVVALTHVGYATGRMHDMAAVTSAAQAAGALVVWDLAHSAGAMDVDIGTADFAVGCGYKYLNGGPGAPAFLYVREDHLPNFQNPISGWFGHAAPFDFDLEFTPADGIARALVGTPHVLSMVALDAALEVFEGVDMGTVRARSESLTGTFIELVEQANLSLRLVSPRSPSERGSQVCLAHPDGYAIVQALIERGVVGDFRAPDIVRFGFAPLYVRHVDVYDAVEVLADVISSGEYRDDRFRRRSSVT